MQDFSRRSRTPELMDSAATSYFEFRDCLRILEHINFLTLAYRPTLSWLERMTAGKPHQALLLYDIGSGGADMIRKIWDWTKKNHLRFRFVAVDLNAWSRQAALQTTPAEVPVRFETGDVFALELTEQPDFIISSLFTHHLSNGDVVSFLRWMDRNARRGWFINDLHRHPVPFYFIKYATRLLVKNRLIRHDAPVSVARAFKKDEWRRLLAQAGIPPEQVAVRWHFPFRYCVERVK